MVVRVNNGVFSLSGSNTRSVNAPQKFVLAPPAKETAGIKDRILSAIKKAIQAVIDFFLRVFCKREEKSNATKKVSLPHPSPKTDAPAPKPEQKIKAHISKEPSPHGQKGVENTDLRQAKAGNFNQAASENKTDSGIPPTSKTTLGREALPSSRNIALGSNGKQSEGASNTVNNNIPFSDPTLKTTTQGKGDDDIRMGSLFSKPATSFAETSPQGKETENPLPIHVSNTAAFTDQNPMDSRATFVSPYPDPMLTQFFSKIEDRLPMQDMDEEAPIVQETRRSPSHELKEDISEASLLDVSSNSSFSSEEMFDVQEKRRSPSHELKEGIAEASLLDVSSNNSFSSTEVLDVQETNPGTLSEQEPIPYFDEPLPEAFLNNLVHRLNTLAPLPKTMPSFRFPFKNESLGAFSPFAGKETRIFDKLSSLPSSHLQCFYDQIVAADRALEKRRLLFSNLENNAKPIQFIAENELVVSERFLHYTPENKDFFNELALVESSGRYSSVDSVILDVAFVHDDNLHGWRRTVGSDLTDSFVDSLIAASDALPNLQSIYHNFHEFANKQHRHIAGISEKSFIALVEAYPKLQHIDILDPNDWRRYTKAVVEAQTKLPDLRVVRFPHSKWPYSEQVAEASKVSPRELKKFLASWKSLEVIHCPDYFTDDHLHVIQEMCPFLQGISFQKCENRGISEEGLIKFLKTCTEIKRIDFHVMWVFTNTLKNLRQYCPQLQELRLYGGFGDYDRFYDYHVEPLGFDPPSLSSLHLRRFFHASDKALMNLLSKLPGLKEFAIDFSPLEFDFLTDDFLASIPHFCPGLQKLHLGKFPTKNVTEEGLIRAIAPLRELVSLKIPLHMDISDKLLITIAKSCPKLRYLDLSWTGSSQNWEKRISKEALLFIGENCPELQSVNVYLAKFHTDPTREEMVQYFPNLVHASNFALHSIERNGGTRHAGFLTDEYHDRHY